MTKYEIKHEWVKALHLGPEISQVLDSAIDHIGHALDNSKPDDWLQLIAIGSIAYHLYMYGGVGLTPKGVTIAGANIQWDPSGQAQVDEFYKRSDQILSNLDDPWWKSVSL